MLLNRDYSRKAKSYLELINDISHPQFTERQSEFRSSFNRIIKTMNFLRDNRQIDIGAEVEHLGQEFKKNRA
jgi:hypothetical protein